MAWYVTMNGGWVWMDDGGTAATTATTSYACVSTTATTTTSNSVTMATWTTTDINSAYAAQRQYMNQMMYVQACGGGAGGMAGQLGGGAGGHRRWLVEQQIAQQRELERHAHLAKERAQELLLSHLTPEQRSSVTAQGWFVVEGGKSKTKYRIRTAHAAANIDVLDAKGDKTHRLCAHCRASEVPLGDQLLTQKLMLECDEDAFLKIANRHAA